MALRALLPYRQANLSPRILSILRTTAITLLLLIALAAVHFLGFLRSMPDGIQRLVASSFAVEFSRAFIYYLALAMLGARMGTYAFAALATSWKLWLQLRQAKGSWQSCLRYMRAAKRVHPILDWPVYVLAPLLLAVLYADLRDALFAFTCIAVALLLLAPIASPQATLAPKRFIARLWPNASLRRVRSSVDLLLLLAVALVSISYYLGKARYARLAASPPATVQSPSYNGEAVVLAQSDSATLVLERSKTSSHLRFILFKEGLLVAETMPPDSHQFEPIRGGK